MSIFKKVLKALSMRSHETVLEPATIQVQFIKPHQKVEDSKIPVIHAIDTRDAVDEEGNPLPSLGFFPVRTIVTHEMYDAFCYATGRDLPDDAGWGRGKRPAINVNALDFMYFCNWASLHLAKWLIYDHNRHLLPANEDGKKMDDQEALEYIFEKATNTEIVEMARNVQGDYTFVMPYIIEQLENTEMWGWFNPEKETVIKLGKTPLSVALPTEEQWKQMLGTAVNQNIDEIAWYAENSNSMTHPVAEKKPNNYGIYDLFGNVWKMVLDQQLPTMDETRWQDKFKKRPYLDRWNPDSPCWFQNIPFYKK